MSELITLENSDALAERVAKDLAEYTKTNSSPVFRIALSGGATPKALFECLAKEPHRSTIDWKKWHVFWGDERCVPKDHPESNYGMAFEALLSRVPIPSHHVYRIAGEEPPAEAARAYEKVLREQFPNVAWPVFDLILLGLGTDGHTASLMPETSALAVEDRWVVENVIRSMQTVRITLTLPVLNSAKAVWFLVSGAKKITMLKKVREESSPALPASLVKPAGDLRWYADQAALGAVVR